jgi:hypothetical protein
MASKSDQGGSGSFGLEVRTTAPSCRSRRSLGLGSTASRGKGGMYSLRLVSSMLTRSTGLPPVFKLDKQLLRCQVVRAYVRADPCCTGWAHEAFAENCRPKTRTAQWSSSGDPCKDSSKRAANEDRFSGPESGPQMLIKEPPKQETTRHGIELKGIAGQLAAEPPFATAPAGHMRPSRLRLLQSSELPGTSSAGNCSKAAPGVGAVLFCRFCRCTHKAMFRSARNLRASASCRICGGCPP